MYEQRMFAGHDPGRCPSCWKETTFDGLAYRHLCTIGDPLEVVWIPIDGGIRLPDLETDRYFVDVAWVGSEWRICLTPKAAPGVYDAGWVYIGKHPQNAIAAAYAWHQADQCAIGTQPRGWIRAYTGSAYR